MSRSNSPSPSPSSSSSASSRLILLGAAAVVLVGVLAWLLLGRGDAPSSDTPDAGARAATETRTPTSPRTGSAVVVASASADGQVRAADGQAIADALVTLVRLDGDGDDDREPMTTRSDTQGAWSFTELAAGRYALSATAPGFLAGVLPSLAIAAGREHAGIELRLSPGGNLLSGTVTDKTGGVIEGAMVQVTPQSGLLRLRERDSYFALSDEHGRYALQVPMQAGRTRVRASHPDYTAESVVLEVAKSELTHDFSLVPTAVVEGVVVRDDDGTPVAHAEVSWARERSIFLPDGGRVSTIERGGRVLADAAGHFRISGLPPGLVVLSARASMLASADPLQLPVGIAERVAGVELRMAAATDVEGRVIAASDGHGIADAHVELSSQMASGARAQTDAEGHFRIVGVLPGSYMAQASAEGFMPPSGRPPMIEVGSQPSSVVLELQLERGRTIRGRVEPPLAAEVGIELRPESVHMGGGGMMMLAGASSTQSVADSGVFELGPVEPGHYTLEARAADGRGGTVEVEVGEDGAEGVVIQLEQRAILSGRVQDFTGKLLADVSVRARKRSVGGSLSVVVNGQELTASSSPTSTEGRFEIAGLAAGAWIVEVVDAQGDVLAMDSGAQLELELGQAEHKQLALRVEPRDGTIRGIVRDAEGQPVADAWVSAAFMPEPAKAERPEGDAHGSHTEMRMVMITDDGASTPRTLLPVLSDEQGRFEFANLRRGAYTLTAELDGGASKATLDGVKPDADVVLELAPLGAIEGRVTHNGKGATCMARISGPSQRSVRVRDGTFEVDRLEPGRYTVEASVVGGSKSETIEVEAGETASVELVLERLSTISGTIVDEDGQPLANVEILIGAGEGGRIEINREDGDPQIFTKDDGTFVAHAAAGGRVLLAQQSDAPMPIVIKPFVVEAGQDIDLGELRKRKMEGMMMMAGPDGPEEPPE